jgi:hypothetical protein
MKKKSESTPSIKAAPFPHVTVIVPVAGASTRLADNLRSLLQQEYPDFSVIFITQDGNDNAVPIIKDLVSSDSRGRLIFAGQATTCSQKNHNLLQGTLAAEPSTEILVFCDSGHEAHPHWLVHLTTPLRVSSSYTVSSGYHHIFSTETNLCVLGRVICVLGLYLARQIPAFAQPWGGATAIRTIDFHQLGIAELWGKTIVDDVTLAAYLRKKKKKVAIPIDADLKTTVDDTSWHGWESWLIRQWAYLKFSFPKLWLASGLTGMMVTLAIYLSLLIVLTGGGGVVPAKLILGAVIFLVIVFFGVGILRFRHPAPGSLVMWYPAFLSAMIMAGWCHYRTWHTDTIVWAGISYKVASGGEVEKIIRPEKQPISEQ